MSGQMFEQLQLDGKRLAAEGKLKESLYKFQEARKILETPKILVRIQKLKDAIACSISSSSKKSQSFQKLDNPKQISRISYGDPKCDEQTSRVLSHIDNIEVKSEIPEESPPSDLPKESFTLPSVLSRKLELGSSNSDGSDFQSVKFKSEKSKTADLSLLSPDRSQQYKNLYFKAKENAAAANLEVALDALNKAKSICPTEMVLRGIKLLQDGIARYNSKKSQSFQKLDGPKLISRISYGDPKCDEQTSRVLSHIDNIEVKSEIPEKSPPSDLPKESFTLPSVLSRKLELGSSNSDGYVKSEIPKKTPPSNLPKESFKLPSVLPRNQEFGSSNSDGSDFQSVKFKSEKSKTADLSLLSPDRSQQCKNLYFKATKNVRAGNLKVALDALNNAKSICPTDVVLRGISILQDAIARSTSSSSKKFQSFQKLDGPKQISCISYGDPKCIERTYRVLSQIDNIEVKSEIPEKSPPSGLPKESFTLPSVLSRKLELGSSNSDGSDFESVKFESEKSKTADLSLLSSDRLLQFKYQYSIASENIAAGNLKVALDALNKAKSICPIDTVLKRIKDLQERIKSTSEEEDVQNEMMAIADGFYVFHEIYEKLYSYQRLGVAWMWELFKKQKGGVLGDDMGLGKTFQVIAFLSGLIDAERAKHVLICMPVSLLTNWENEFQKWCPRISVCVFHGGSKKERERNILRVQLRGHVLLTSYGMVLNGFENLSTYEGRQFIWDYVILDEGHKIRNPTKTTKAVHNIPSKNRLVLTGTPIQNNLRELWALYDFAHQGTLVGSMKTFKMQYENPITRAREEDATVGEKHLGTEMAENLRMLIEPYFLRRTKAEILGKSGQNSGIDDLEKSTDKLSFRVSSNNKFRTRKNDLIVWTFLSKTQCEIYQSFLHSDAVKATLVSKKSPLVELTTLKKICDHPRLLSQRACLELGLNGESNECDLDEETSNASSIENVSDDTLIDESGKMRFLINLLEILRKEDHRTLVCSLSKSILDMVHRILVNRSFKVMRLDGTVTKMEERERRIQMFQTNASYSVFLLTTQVGGVGITLTAADRVIIYDPSWNPATDTQAVDRIYRIGQQKNVVVYRLITCGTVEEKIYRRQIFKDSITKQVTGTNADPSRYFSKQELRELFTLDNPHYSTTQVQLNQLHSDQRITDVSLDDHITLLHFLNIFGISDHDLMFSKDIVDDTEDNDEMAVSHGHMKKQVAVYQEPIRGDVSLLEEEEDLYKTPSVIQANYPSVPSLPTKSDSAKIDRKLSYIDYKGAGDQTRVSEVIDLCDSPKKSPLISKYEESKSSPMSSRRSTKNYEPLLLKKNKINNYFPETGILKLRNSSPIPDSVSPQLFSTPNKQNISIYETPDTSYNEKKQKPAVIQNPRKSCAIQKSFIGYESYSSQHTSNPSSAPGSEDKIIESDSEFGDARDLGLPIKEVDSSLSFIASSIPNSSYINKDKTLIQNLAKISPGRRITPLRLCNNFDSSPNKAFALAMATSPIFIPVSQSPVVGSPPRKISRVSRSLSEEDSPVQARKTIKRIIIVTDSDE